MRAIVQVKTPGGLYLEGRFNGGFLAFMDSQRVTLVVLLDQSVAFDTVDHDVLLNRLSTSFGVRGSALRCFASYLPNRYQPVSFDQKLSENFQLDCGVPQGSCLCPLLFMIYASGDLRSLKSTSPMQAHAYASDTQLYLSFKADSTSSQIDAVNSIEHCVDAIGLG